VSELYHDKYSILTHASTNVQPFDIVFWIIRCTDKWPNVAKEILAVNPHQRILFVSAYINSIVEESFAMQQLLKQETVAKTSKPRGFDRHN
jgi:hypothetical protein